MRPDSLTNEVKAQNFLKKSAYTMSASTVMPSVTLPCHMSLFHSVDPSRHGTTTNTYMPQVRPVKGLCEVLVESKKKIAFFYNWEQLRDVSSAGSLEFSYFCKGHNIGYDVANDIITDAAEKYLAENYTDFAFLYLGNTDEVGHKYGWMSNEYMESVSKSWDNINRIVDSLPDDYTVIVTADHGGHERMHGTDIPEDMTIPLIITGKNMKPGESFENANIKDIAPTVAKLLDIYPDEEWEGKSLV